MKRREFITAFGGAAATVAWPLVGRAEETTKLPRIGVLWHAANVDQEAVYLGALRQGLGDFGYVEGKNITLEMRFPAEQYERFFTLAAELVQLHPDVLVSAAGTAAIALHQATTTIPLVFVNVPDPVGRKLVASLSRPGGNATGLSNMAVDLTKKRIELAKEVIPGLSRVAMLVNASDEVGSQAFIADGEAAARELGIAVVPVGVRGRKELEAAISKISEDKFPALVVTVDGMFFTERQRIADLTLAQRLPTIVYSREPLEAGALISYGPSAPLLYRRAGYFIDKILKGAKPADLPVEQPTKFELLINLKTAGTLGLKVPPALLTRADDVID
jgi:putative ABC transport system substrate-binding protein